MYYYNYIKDKERGFNMKKQKFKKEKTKSNEEIMIERFKKYSTFFEILELLVKVAIVLGIIAILLILFTKAESNKEDITFYYNQIMGKFDGNQIDDLSDNIETQKIIVIVDYLVAEIKFIAVAYLFNLLRKIFNDSIENKTPFTENNVKNMKKMVGAVVIFGAAQMSILSLVIFTIIIVTIYQIFNYGYLLQKESDELL